MKKEVSPLFSQYILDGVQMEETPFSALYDCLDGNGTVDVPAGPFEDVVDEYMDKTPAVFEYDSEAVESYIEHISRLPHSRKAVDLSYPVGWTKAAISSVLLDAMFREGDFCLQDLMLIARWNWNNAPAGNLAAFYDSTVTAGRYLFDLGVRLDRYFVEESKRECTLELELCTKIPRRRACPSEVGTDSSDWLIYIPFESCRYALGGSALAYAENHGGGAEMDMQDPDYFVDCYEVVRELVQDGIVMAGVPVGRGGLACAAKAFCGKGGFKMDIGGIMANRGEKDPVKVLFAEMPGVLVQIMDVDYDYVDSQLMLQEVAYFPVGHPSASLRGLSIEKNLKDGVSGILESLLAQASEGED